jgi:hypothetical protein
MARAMTGSPDSDMVVPGDYVTLRRRISSGPGEPALNRNSMQLFATTESLGQNKSRFLEALQPPCFLAGNLTSAAV